MGDWRAIAEEALRNGNDRIDRNDSPPTVPNVPIVPTNPERVLRGWCAAIEALDPCEPRPGFTIGRWQKLYDCSVWLAEAFGRHLALDGWSTGDVFGIHPQCEGYGGLVDQLGNHRALVLADGEARWRHLGTVPQVYRRGWWPDLQPFWSVEL